MQVQNINSSNYKNHYSPNFGTMNVTKKGQKLLNKWWQHRAPKNLLKIEEWKKELADTKYFDLEIGEINGYLSMLIHQKDSFCISSNDPLRVFSTLLDNKPVGNKLTVFGHDSGSKLLSYQLEFASEKEAENAFNILKKYEEGKSAYSIDMIAWAVDSVKIWEKAFEHMKNPK